MTTFLELKQPVHLNFVDSDCSTIALNYYAFGGAIALNLLSNVDGPLASLSVNLDESSTLNSDNKSEQITKATDLIGMKFFLDANQSAQEFAKIAVKNHWFKKTNIIAYSGFNTYKAYEILPDFVNSKISDTTIFDQNN